MTSDDILSYYDYDLDPALVAQQPADPRDSSRLLIYNRDTKKLQHDRFLNLPLYLPKDALLIFNNTKVVPAKFTVDTESNKKAELLYVGQSADEITVMSSENLKKGSTLSVDGRLFFEVLDENVKYFRLKPSFPIEQLFRFLHQYGRTPLPPYISNTPLSEDELREKYQSVFARHEGSVAAPTASLHFTDRLFERLKRAGIQYEFITLHVNEGTFGPVLQENIESKTLHKEFYEISATTAKALNNAKEAGRPILAIGTTVTRALEAATNQDGIISEGTNATDLFIWRGFEFKTVNHMVTNFHTPKSSVLMLTSAFVGSIEEVQYIYDEAAFKQYRFFSFGDGMLVL